MPPQLEFINRMLINMASGRQPSLVPNNEEHGVFEPEPALMPFPLRQQDDSDDESTSDDSEAPPALYLAQEGEYSSDDDVPGLRNRQPPRPNPRVYHTPLLVLCATSFRLRPAAADQIRELVEENVLRMLEKTTTEKRPLQIACQNRHLHSEIRMYLAEKQAEAIQIKRNEFNPGIDESFPFLPDLVVAELWEFLKPDVWHPLEDDLMSDDDSDSDSDDSSFDENALPTLVRHAPSDDDSSSSDDDSTIDMSNLEDVAISDDDGGLDSDSDDDDSDDSNAPPALFQRG